MAERNNENTHIKEQRSVVVRACVRIGRKIHLHVSECETDYGVSSLRQTMRRA